MSTEIYVDNLPLDATAIEIRELFCPYGPVESVHLIKDQETGWLRFRGHDKRCERGDCRA